MKKNNYHFKNLIFGIFLAIILSLFFGCRSVKKDVKKDETKTEINTDSVAENKNNVVEKSKKTVNEKTRNNIQNSKKKVVLVPVDKDKPIEMVDSKGEKTTVFNASVELSEETTSDNTEKEIKTDSEAEKSDKSNSNVSVKNNSKKSQSSLDSSKDAKASLFFILLPYALWILFFLLLYFVWRNRKRIPYVKNFF